MHRHVPRGWAARAIARGRRHREMRRREMRRRVARAGWGAPNRRVLSIDIHVFVYEPRVRVFHIYINPRGIIRVPTRIFRRALCSVTRRATVNASRCERLGARASRANVARAGTSRTNAHDAHISRWLCVKVRCDFFVYNRRVHWRCARKAADDDGGEVRRHTRGCNEMCVCERCAHTFSP